AANRVPDRKRHAEEPLTADAPVAGQAVHPVLVAMPHVFRMPPQLPSAREELLPELHRLDEPLAARDDLQRAVALLVELDRVRDRTRLADQVARLTQLLDDRRACLRRLQGDELIVGLLGARRIRRFPAGLPPRDGAKRAGRLDHRTYG